MIMCGNMLSCFAQLDDRGDRPNQLLWLELLHTSCISLLNQAGKGRVFYSVGKCFEIRTDPRNIFGKQTLKISTAFYCVIPRDYGVEIESSHHIAGFSKSARARSKNCSEPP